MATCYIWFVFVIIIREANSNCLLNGAGNTLPVLRDFNFSEISKKIIRHHQVIVHNFRFQCCGNITAWGADVFRGRNGQQNEYTIDFQVWRPSPTVEDSIGAGQYSLVGNNKFTSISLLNMDNYLVRVTPSPQDYIQFQPGDVLGFYVEKAMSVSDGVVLITTSGFSNESVWQASVDPTIATIQTIYSIGTSGVLNTAIPGAPVISVNVENTYPCPSSQTVAGSSVIVTDTTLQENTDVSSPLQSGLIAGIVVAVLALLISAGVVLPLILIIYSLKKKLNANDRAAFVQDGMDNKVYGAQSGQESFTMSTTDKSANPTLILDTAGEVGSRIESTYEDVGPPEDAETHSTEYTEIGYGKRETITSDYEITEPMDGGGSGDVFDSAGTYVPTEEVRKTWNGGVNLGHCDNITLQLATYNKLKFFQREEVYWAPASTTSDLYSQLASKKYREIPQNQLTILEELGSGEFGQVCKAVWSISGATKELAVKTLRAELPEEEKVRFLQEAAIMGQFSHPNVVKLYGVVTVGEPLMMCLELMTNSDLRTYLCSIKPVQQDHRKLERMFMDFSKQIAAGMNYLSKKSFVHRDLAARNVLLDGALTCKIGDFGLTRDLMDETYYTPKVKGGKIPVKWTAPEALYYKKYSIDSDVWSYGMVLFEIWSVGKKPFSQFTNNQVSRLLKRGHCQPPPPGCPRAVYKLMVDCWCPDHHQRPSFQSICAYLQQLHIGIKNDVKQGGGNSLGAELEVAAEMYSDLQNTYLKTVTATAALRN